MTTREEDAAARQRALDPDHSFVVEALAGSGKTSLLTQRLLVLLARVDEPEQILAVTFTRKAVEELRGRVLDALASADGPPPTKSYERQTWELACAVAAHDRARGWQLLTQPSRLRIQTIDALAATLARQAPLTAGPAAALSPAEDAAPLYQRAVRETLDCLEDAHYGPLVAQALTVLDNDWRRTEALLTEMLPRREQWLARAVKRPSRALAEQTLRAAVAPALKALSASLPQRLHHELTALAHAVGATFEVQAPESPLTVLASLDLDALTVESAGALARWLLQKDGKALRKTLNSECVVAGEEGRALKARYKAFAEQLQEASPFLARLRRAKALPDGRYSDDAWASVSVLLDFLTLAVIQLRLVFDEQQLCDFQAIADSALQALGELEAPSEFALRQDLSLKHLLVDEFQDTSRSQHDFFELLTQAWTVGDGRTLFLVGDPRQSIYRFRQAEVGLFSRIIAERRFGGVPVECLRLSANFRTCAPLIDWLNLALPTAFASTEDRLPRFGGLVSTREGDGAPAVQIHPLPPKDALAEAEALLAIIQSTRAVRPAASIAVLVRSRSHLGLLPLLLEQAGIPVAATDVAPLNEMPLVGDLIALTRALMHQQDRIAWLALLRAPWCGLSLNALASLTEGDRWRSLWTLMQDPQRLAALAVDDAQRLQALLAVLEPALRRARREPWSTVVEDTWLALGGPQLWPEEQLRYADRYFGLLAEFEARNPEFAAETFEAMLTERYAPTPRHQGNAVALMTIHKSKGLEFDVVILPALDRGVRTDTKPLMVWHEAADLPPPNLLLAPLPAVGAGDSRNYDFVRGLDQEEQSAEMRRLLYVALTRARDQLHLCAQRLVKVDGSLCKPKNDSFLAMLWPCLAASFQADLPTNAAGARQLPKPAALRLGLAGLPAAPTAAPDDLSAPADIEFDWASPVAKHVGTVTHLLLELIATEGLDAWDEHQLAGARDFVLAELRACGLLGDSLRSATGRVMAAVSGALQSTRGRWILSNDHQQAAAEYRIAAIRDGVLADAVLDRTFIDADGTRWIIDFKTGDHQGGRPEAFMDSELERYRPQLTRYAELLYALEPRPIKLALYFPLLDGWREWQWTPARPERSPP